jgi:phosphoribosylaminoimidazole-succinocarboxamide synthase
MTASIVEQISDRYIELYENITGERFEREDISDVHSRIERNCMDFLKNL